MIQGVETHINPLQSRRLQSFYFLCQERAVRGQAKIPQPFNGRQLGNQKIEIAPHQRLSSGEPDLFNAQADKEPRQAGDLFKGQNLFLLDPLVVVERHAVGAAKVTPVGDGNPEVLDESVKCVLKHLAYTMH